MTRPTRQQRLHARDRPDGRSPVMYQKWRHLLFLHWAFDPGEIQATLPPGLTVDRFEGRAYLGVVPFFMRDIRPRFLPSIPGLSNFLEMNVRTYVFDNRGTPGVWFYTLDANQRLAIYLARRFFFLSYSYASMSAAVSNASIEYSYHRAGTEETARGSFHYRPGVDLTPAREGTLEYFLIERYILFSHDRRSGQLYSGRVHHRPYPLAEAEVERYSDSPIELAGFARPNRRPEHQILSRGVDVEIFALQALGR